MALRKIDEHTRICPNCNSVLQKVRRTRLDKLKGCFVSVRRYTCTTPACFNGLLKVSREYEKKARLLKKEFFFQEVIHIVRKVIIVVFVVLATLIYLAAYINKQN